MTAASEPFEIQPEDTLVVLESYLKRKGTDGILAARDLSSSTSVKFSLINAATGVTVIDEAAATIVTAAEGLVRYTFEVAQVGTPGIYWYRWKEYVSSAKASYPVRHNGGQLWIHGETMSAQQAYQAAVAAM